MMPTDEEEKGFKFTDKRRLSPETGEVRKEEALKEAPNI